MPDARCRRPGVLWLALLLACTPLLPGRGADSGLPPPPPAAPFFSRASEGTVVLARVYANTARDDEFIEIANEAAQWMDLSGWSLTDREDTARFPAGTSLVAGGRLVATRNATSFLEDLRRPPDFTYERGDGPHMEGGSLRLADAGDEVLLRDSAGSVVDAYVYGTSAYVGPGWDGSPAPAAGRGELATRMSEGGRLVDHDDASDWEGPRTFRLGQSAFRPPAVTLGREPVAILSPDDGRAPVLSFLRSAESSIEVAVYTLTSSVLGAVLADRARAGAHVRVLLEGSPVGGVEDRERCIVAGLLEAGVEARWLTSASSAVKRYRYLHAKYAIVDGVALLVSSENFGDAGFPPPGAGGNRGWSVLVEDLALAEQAWEVFEEDFDPSRGDSVPAERTVAPCLGDPGAVRPWVRPAASGERRAQLVIGPDTSLDPEALLGLIASARDRLWIEAFYLEDAWDGGPNPFVEAAFASAHRGVSVRLLLDGSGWSTEEGSEGNDAVAARLNGRAREEGVDLDVRLRRPGGSVERVHNKGAVVDGRAVLVSSMNWAQGSATENRELGLILEDPEVAARFEDAFRRDWDGLLSTSRDGPTIDDPATLAGIYAFIAAASALSLRKMRRRDKGLKPGPSLNRRGRPLPHLGRGHREVRVLSPELVAQPRDGAGGGVGDRGGGDEAPGGLGGPEGD